MTNIFFIYIFKTILIGRNTCFKAVSAVNKVKIDIGILSIGLHELEFVEHSKDFEIEDQEMFPNPVYSHVFIDKGETHIYIKANVCSKAHFFCDRCLREFNQDLSGNMNIYYEVVSKGSKGHLVDAEVNDPEHSVRIYRPDKKVIDLSPDILETLFLTIPMKMLCSEDCVGLCPGCAIDLSVDSCDCVKNENDPRWDALKQLIDKEPNEN